MATFPAGGILRTGSTSPAPRPNVIRTEMEDGVAKQRKKLSKDVMTDSVVYTYSLAELATFETFFFTTTDNGSEYFDFTHPIYGSISCRIVGGQYSAPALNANLTHVNVSFEIEWFR